MSVVPRVCLPCEFYSQTVRWQSGQRQLALPLPRQGCFWTEFCSQRVRASVECACCGVLTAVSDSCNFVRGFCPSIVLEFKTTELLYIQVLVSQDRPNLIRKQMSLSFCNTPKTFCRLAFFDRAPACPVSVPSGHFGCNSNSVLLRIRAQCGLPLAKMRAESLQCESPESKPDLFVS